MKFKSLLCLFLLLVSAPSSFASDGDSFDSEDVQPTLSTLFPDSADSDVTTDSDATTLPPAPFGAKLDETFSNIVCRDGFSKLILADGVENLEEKVKLTLVDNFLDFKNNTDPSDLKRIEVEGLLGLFSKESYWRLREENSLVYPVLIKVAVKQDFCKNPTLRHIDFDSSEDAETSLKINNQWHSFDDDMPVPTVADETSFFEIYLNLESSSEGGIKDLKVVFCCSDV